MIDCYQDGSNHSADFERTFDSYRFEQQRSEAHAMWTGLHTLSGTALAVQQTLAECCS